MTKFEVNYPARGDNWRTYEAFDAEEAAKEFGVAYNEDGEYTLMNKEIYVRVRDEQGEITVVSVSAEAEICYSSEEVERVNCRECKKNVIEQIKKGEVLYSQEFCSRECYCKRYCITDKKESAPSNQGGAS